MSRQLKPGLQKTKHNFWFTSKTKQQLREIAEHNSLPMGIWLEQQIDRAHKRIPKSPKED